MKPAFPVALLLLAVLSSPARAVDDPFARWTFDAGNGADISGNALDLTPNGGITYSAGRSGLRAVLDGTTGQFEHAADPAFAPGPDGWTLFGWVLAKPDTTQAHMVVSWYRCGANPGCTTSDGAGYQLYLRADGRAEFWMRDDTLHEFLMHSSAILTDGRWHLVTGTLDAATDHATLYVDGVAAHDSSTTFAGVTPGPISIPLTVGRMYRVGWATPTNYFHGSLDDVRLYRRPLSASEVLALYQGGVVGMQAGTPAFALGRAAPNPTRAGSSVRASLEAPCSVRLAVFDAAGRLVRRLFDGPRDAGEFAQSWDGTDDAGRAVAPGVYFYQLDARGADGKTALRTSRVTLVH